MLCTRERRTALRQALVCAFLLGVCISSGYAVTDSTTRQPEVILFVGHLNFDCWPDTVMGINRERSYLPVAIHWGRAVTRYRFDATARRFDTIAADSPCTAAPVFANRVPVTTLRYPAWTRIHGSVAFRTANPDTLSDMMLFIRGNTSGSAEERDTLRPLLIFGQLGLDTLAELDLSQITSFQTAPFVAMELHVGSELVEPEVRDLSGIVSYTLASLPIHVGDHSTDTTDEGGEAPSDSVVAQPIRIRVFPNPTGVSAQLQVDSIPMGDYIVEVAGVNGLVYLHEDVTVSSSAGLFQVLDLSDVPTGYYIIRVFTGAQLYAVYPIIITR